MGGSQVIAERRGLLEFSRETVAGASPHRKRLAHYFVRAEAADLVAVLTARLIRAGVACSCADAALLGEGTVTARDLAEAVATGEITPDDQRLGKATWVARELRDLTIEADRLAALGC